MASRAPNDDLKLQYLQMQQESDFALWRAREANGEVKRAFANHLAGEGNAPSKQELDAVALLETDAETKYRELRQFVRAFFG